MSFAGDVEFTRLCAGAAEVDLVRLMLEFAADAYPQLDTAGTLVELERLASLARQRCEPLRRAGDGIEAQLQSVSQLLYEVEGFHGNQAQYYDSRNSYLHEVLARRTGIPISLGILYRSVARAAGLDVFGVGVPAHFVLGCRAEHDTLYIDPFSHGDVLTLEECRQRIDEMLKQPGALSPGHFRPATDREIAVRVLRNLKACYVSENRWPMALPVQQRISLLLPREPLETRDLGLIYLRLAQGTPALALLEKYVAVCEEDEKASLQPYVRSARRLVAEMN